MKHEGLKPPTQQWHILSHNNELGYKVNHTSCFCVYDASIYLTKLWSCCIVQEKRPALPCIIHSFHMSTMLHHFWCLWALYLAPLFCCNKDGRSKDKAHYNTKHTGGISTTQTQQTQTRTKVTHLQAFTDSSTIVIVLWLPSSSSSSLSPFPSPTGEKDSLLQHHILLAYNLQTIRNHPASQFAIFLSSRQPCRNPLLDLGIWRAPWSSLQIGRSGDLDLQYLHFI